jgi:hypothetical protein
MCSLREHNSRPWRSVRTGNASVATIVLAHGGVRLACGSKVPSSLLTTFLREAQKAVSTKGFVLRLLREAQ